MTANAATRAAVRYAELGVSVVRLRAGEKKPDGAWRDRQHEPMTPAETSTCFNEPGNVGIVTGAVSRLVVLDVDGDEGERSLEGLHLPETVEARTRRGRHLYFEHPGTRVGNRAAMLPGLDLRGDGGYVVAPGSVVDGTAYRWEEGRELGEHPLAAMPPWLEELVRSGGTNPVSGPAAPPTDIPPLYSPHGKSVTDWADTIRFGAVTGRRNDTLTRLAGYLLGARRIRVPVDVVTELLVAVNEGRFRPPLPREQVERTVSGIAAAERRKSRRGSRPSRSRKSVKR